MQRSTQHPRRRAWLRRLIVVAVLAAAVGALLSQTVFAQTSYIITDGDRVTVHRSYSSDPYEVLTEAGIELEEEDTYETGYADGMNQITVRRMQMVTVINRGAQSVIGTYGETAGSLLARMGITPGTGDTLSCSSETQTYDGMTIELVHTETRIEEEDTVVPYPVNYYEDPDLEPGAEIVLVAGQNGLTHVKSEVTYRNGKEVSRVIVQETVQTKPVTQLVIRGVDRTIMEQPPIRSRRSRRPLPPRPARPPAAPRPARRPPAAHAMTAPPRRAANVIMTSSGESYTYVDVMTCSATAYTCEGYGRPHLFRHAGPRGRHRGRPDRHPARHEDVCRFKRQASMSMATAWPRTSAAASRAIRSTCILTPMPSAGTSACACAPFIFWAE